MFMTALVLEWKIMHKTTKLRLSLVNSYVQFHVPHPLDTVIERLYTAKKIMVLQCTQSHWYNLGTESPDVQPHHLPEKIDRLLKK